MAEPRLHSRHQQAFELLAVCLAVAGLLLPSSAAAAVLVALGIGVWATLRPVRRERNLLLPAGALTVGLLLAGIPAERQKAGMSARWWEETRAGYAFVWRDLATTAARGREALQATRGGPQGGLAPTVSDQRRWFEQLATTLARGAPGVSLLLLDPDGRAVIWAGPGLRHELAAPHDADLPRRGCAFRLGYEVATVAVVEPLSEERRPWRLVAGRSVNLEGSPFGPALPLPLRFTLAAAGPVPAPADVTEIALLAHELGPLADVEAAPPRLWLVPESLVGSGPSAAALRWRRWAALVLGAGLLAVAALRAAGLALLASTVLHDRWRSALTTAIAGLGLVAVASGLGVSLGGQGALALALTLAVLGVPRRRVNVWLGAAVAGGGAVLPLVAGVLLAPTAWLGRGRGPAAWSETAAELPDLGIRLFGDPDAVSLRLALLAGTWGLLRIAAGQLRGSATRNAAASGGRPARDSAANDPAAMAGAATSGPNGSRVSRSGLALGAVGLGLAAGAAAESPVLALPLLVASGGVAAMWQSAVSNRAALTSRLGLVLLAGLIAAGCWETAWRWRLERELPRLVTAFAPPEQPVRDQLAAAVAAGFTGRDLAELGPDPPAGARERDRQDLALALWRRSPLARADALSAIAVLPPDGPPLVYTYGLPTTDDGAVDLDNSRWPGLLLPGWESAMVSGETALDRYGEPWGRIRFWLVPRPGFGLAPEAPGLLGANLLRSAAGAGALERLPADMRLTIRDEAERQVLIAGGNATSTRARSLATAPFTELAMLRQGPLRALERTATHALGTLLVLGCLGLAAVPLLLGRDTVRDTVRRSVRSYSQRLVLVTTALAILPLALLNAVLLRGVEQRLEREQRLAGEAALSGAQRVLGEYLGALDPGYGLDTAVDERLLSWLARVVHHDVNLYWNSELYRSSRQELFSGGLMPRRIPGEVYARLSLVGEPTVARENRLDGAVGPAGWRVVTGRPTRRAAAWIELYAPLRLSGMPAEQRLFLSVPLISQQAEVSAELAAERRRALLLTAALILVLLRVVAELARNFARPVSELVEGTRRIAAGAPALLLGSDAAAPREPELAELVAAVDDMARRIASGREQLLREKLLVERVVANITSGVVSLDRKGCVVMLNRVAAELLGVAVGDDLELALALRPELTAVRELVERGRRQLELATDHSSGRVAGGFEPRLIQTTVALVDADGRPERDWTLVYVPLGGATAMDAGGLLVVEDTTEVLRGQRLAAWAEMAKIIAHEVKNPLTPIRLSAEHLREVRRRDPAALDLVFDRCVDNILRHVEELRGIANEFSIYSHLPTVDREPGDLVELVATVAGGYQAAPPPGVEVELSATPSTIAARFDRRLLTRAVRNLIENAIRVSGNAGLVEVRVELGEEGSAVVRVLDRGPGVAADQLAKIFEPYFSTHAGGTGLGLPIAQRIAAQHGGGIEARNRDGGGLEVVLSIAR